MKKIFLSPVLLIVLVAAPLLHNVKAGTCLKPAKTLAKKPPVSETEEQVGVMFKMPCYLMDI
jgi:hypothetical protein